MKSVIAESSALFLFSILVFSAAYQPLKAFSAAVFSESMVDQSLVAASNSAYKATISASSSVFSWPGAIFPTRVVIEAILAV